MRSRSERFGGVGCGICVVELGDGKVVKLCWRALGAWLQLWEGGGGAARGGERGKGTKAKGRLGIMLGLEELAMRVVPRPLIIIQASVIV